MAGRTYPIALDLLNRTLVLDALKESAKTSAIFINCWNHGPGVFLVVSDQSAAAIGKALRQYTKEARLLVVEINTDRSDGWLPETGWKWIGRRSDERVGDRA